VRDLGPKTGAGPTAFTREDSFTNQMARKFNYNDPDLVFRMSPSGPIVMGGTKEKLLILLTNISVIKKRYILEFLAIYPYFATCEEVCDCLSKAYFNAEVPNEILEPKLFRDRVKKRVLYILVKWVTNYPKHFFIGKCIPKLGEFLNKLDESPDKELLLGKYEKIKTFENKFEFLTPRVVNDKTKSPLFSFKPEVLAQQITIIDQKLFCEIELHELKGQRWTDTNAFQTVPHITRSIEFFNRVSYWCATEIVSQKSLKRRVKALKRIILVAKKCSQLQNFNALFAIVSSLNFAAIVRLKLTWKALPERYLDMLESLNELCCVETHYLPYKKLISTLKPPMIPYLGVCLRDLTFLEVGNATYLDEEKKIINFDKFRMLAAVLADIEAYQGVPYLFEPVPAVQYSLRHSLLTLDPDELFNLSRIVEPSSLKRTSIAQVVRKERNRSGSNLLRSIKKSIT